MNGNNLDQVRQHNLSVVLRLVHENGSPSRAWLTRETGLNRSTIAALVAELVERELVIESEPDQTKGVGRPSLIIRPSERTLAIAVHPELDAVEVGVVALGGRVLQRRRLSTARIPTVQEAVEVVASAITEIRAELGDGSRIVGIGLAVPGLVRESDGVVSVAPHLGWTNEPLAERLEAATGFSVASANDANAGAIAERVFGAGRGIDELIYLNGGASGIGGGVITSGKLLRGASGFAGEIGHTMVNSAGVHCHCGSSGCLETEVWRAPLLAALGLGAAEAERLDDELTAAFAPDATPSAELVELVHRQLGFLGRALGNTANIFNPQMIVLGGFLGSLYSVAPEVLDAAMRASAMAAVCESIEIRRAELGSNILMIGAAELAFAGILTNPGA
ncbi:MAG: ROK family transcriptional regulator [Lacisediminihabitans sp.]